MMFANKITLIRYRRRINYRNERWKSDCDRWFPGAVCVKCDECILLTPLFWMLNTVHNADADMLTKIEVCGRV